MSLVGLLVLTMCCAAVVQAADDTDAIVRQLYQSRIEAAQRTQGADDDVALAKEMVDAARKAAAQPPLSLSLARAAYNVISTRTEGVQVAHEALKLIDGHAPQDRLRTRGDAVAIWTAAHRRAAGEAKAATSAGLVAAMRWAAEAHAEAGQWQEAATLLQQAASLARISNHADAEQVRAEFDLAQHRQRAANQVARLRQSLLSSTRETVLAEQLAKLMLIDLDTPHAAADLAPIVTDESLQRVITLAARAETELSADEHQALGDWYFEQSKAAAEVVKPAVQRRAAVHLTHFLRQHKEQDLARSKAELTLKTLEAALAEDVPVVEPVTPPKPDWKDRVVGNWTVGTFHLTLNPDGTMNGNYKQFRGGTWRVIGERQIQLTNAGGGEFLKIEFTPEFDSGEGRWVAGVVAKVGRR